MKVLKIQFKAFTASFRIPFAYTGVQLSIPVPSYSNILGLISCCAGRNIEPEETSIGFEFTYKSKSIDLERFIRWDYNPSSPGRAKLNIKGPAIRQREFLLYPKLNLYLTNLDFNNYFLKPLGIPTLGRSQDISWVEDISEINLEPIKKGKIKGTLIPFHLSEKQPIEGLLLRLPEYMIYNQRSKLRRPKNNILFVATNSKLGKNTKIDLEHNLFTSPSFKSKDRCIYLHKWIN